MNLIKMSRSLQPRRRRADLGNSIDVISPSLLAVAVLFDGDRLSCDCCLLDSVDLCRDLRVGSGSGCGSWSLRNPNSHAF